MNQQQLLQLMSDGRFHSGEELGKKLGVSRAAVWKQLRQLEGQGIAVESIKGKGYRFAEPLELLDKSAIRGLLDSGEQQLLAIFEVLDVVDSTNRKVLSLLASHQVPGIAVLAESQTAGKGRRGKTWVSPYGKNLYLSVGWIFQGGVRAIQGLSLALGVAAAQAIAQLGVKGVQLKWPNDLLYKNKKLGGILVELEGDPSGECFVVAGIGVNTSAYGDMDKIDQPWTDISTIKGQPISRNQLVAAILAKWLPLLAGFADQGFSAYRDKWIELDCFANKTVKLIIGKQQLEGTARGVDSEGSLLLEVDGRVETYSGGEISVRLRGDS